MATVESNSSPPNVTHYRKRSKSTHTLTTANGSRTVPIGTNDTSDSEDTKLESNYSESNGSPHKLTRLRSRAASCTDLLNAHILDDSDMENDDNNIKKRMITSLQLKISHLEYVLHEIRSQYNDIDSKYKKCIKENEIFKEYMIKYDNKCNEYDSLISNYDEVKTDLFNSKTKQQLYFDHNKELQIQKDELIERYEHIEQENMNYKHEINELQQMRESLNIELITSQNDINNLQKELTTFQSINANENVKEINNFKQQIRKLKKANTELQIKLKLRNDLDKFTIESDSRDRYSFDENEFESEEKTSSQSNNFSPNIVHYNEHDEKKSRSRSASPNHISETWHNSRTNTAHFNCEDLEFINLNGHNEHEHVFGDSGTVAEISDSLWHDIDIQIIKIESLAMSGNVYNESVGCARSNINMLDDIYKLPDRLGYIYNELEQTQCDMKEDIKQRYESMISLNEIKIKNLQNKIKEIKTKNDTLQYNLMNMQQLYEGYKIQTKDYLNQYKRKIEYVNNKLTDSINEMSELKYWQRKVRRYGASAVVIFVIIYLVYHYYKNKNKVRGWAIRTVSH